MQWTVQLKECGWWQYLQRALSYTYIYNVYREHFSAYFSFYFTIYSPISTSLCFICSTSSFTLVQTASLLTYSHLYFSAQVRPHNFVTNEAFKTSSFSAMGFRKFDIMPTFREIFWLKYLHENFWTKNDLNHILFLWTSALCFVSCVLSSWGRCGLFTLPWKPTPWDTELLCKAFPRGPADGGSPGGGDRWEKLPIVLGYDVMTVASISVLKNVFWMS